MKLLCMRISVLNRLFSLYDLIVFEQQKNKISYYSKNLPAPSASNTIRKKSDPSRMRKSARFERDRRSVLLFEQKKKTQLNRIFSLNETKKKCILHFFPPVFPLLIECLV